MISDLAEQSFDAFGAHSNLFRRIWPIYLFPTFPGDLHQGMSEAVGLDLSSFLESNMHSSDDFVGTTLDSQRCLEHATQGVGHDLYFAADSKEGILPGATNIGFLDPAEDEEENPSEYVLATQVKGQGTSSLLTCRTVSPPLPIDSGKSMSTVASLESLHSAGTTVGAGQLARPRGHGAVEVMNVPGSILEFDPDDMEQVQEFMRMGASKSTVVPSPRQAAASAMFEGPKEEAPKSKKRGSSSGLAGKVFAHPNGLACTACGALVSVACVVRV